MDATAAAIWRSAARVLVQRGTLWTCDLPALARYVRTAALWRRWPTPTLDRMARQLEHAFGLTADHRHADA